ncbi:MAG: hypothetical protein HYU51_03550 [Candidatus Rokubacteria bacterium]|nr:hypothetical protein [Candidatus Rokubacteria bacterium]
MARRITDSEAMRRIHRILDGREWSGADDLEAVAEVVRATGREIRPPVDGEDEDDGERLGCDECGESFNVNESASETHCPRHA